MTQESAAKLLVFVDGNKTHNFKFLGPGRSGYFYFVAHFAIEQSPADGRGGGDKTLLGVGFFRADQLVFDLDVAVCIQHNDAGAVAGTIFGDIGEVEHAEIAHALFKLADASVDEALALLGKLVFGVFGEVAVGPGYRNFLGKVDAALVLEGGEFVLNFLLNFLQWIRHG